MLITPLLRIAAAAAMLLAATPASAQFTTSVIGPHFRMQNGPISIETFHGKPLLCIVTIGDFPMIGWYPDNRISNPYPGVRLKRQHVHLLNSEPCQIGMYLQSYDMNNGPGVSQNWLRIDRLGWNPPLDPTWPINPNPSIMEPNGNNDRIEEFHIRDHNGGLGACTSLLPYPTMLIMTFEVELL